MEDVFRPRACVQSGLGGLGFGLRGDLRIEPNERLRRAIHAECPRPESHGSCEAQTRRRDRKARLRPAAASRPRKTLNIYANRGRASSPWLAILPGFSTPLTFIRLARRAAAPSAETTPCSVAECQWPRRGLGSVRLRSQRWRVGRVMLRPSSACPHQWVAGAKVWCAPG
jgi:hypothetical protein